MNVTPVEARKQFDAASKSFLPQFAGLEVRVIFAELNGEKVLLGGKARYFDVTPETVDAPSCSCLGGGQVLLPMASTKAFLDNLFDRRIELDGHSIRIATLQGNQPTTDFVEKGFGRNFQDEDEDGFGVSWYAAHPDDLLGRPSMDALEKELRTSPGAHNDLKELLDFFTPGLDAGRGVAIRFDLRIPVLVKGTLRRSGQALKLLMRCGNRVETSKLYLTFRSGKNGLGAARGVRTSQIDPENMTWHQEARQQVGELSMEAPAGTQTCEVRVAYQGYPFTIHEQPEGSPSIDQLLSRSLVLSSPSTKMARWKNIVYGGKYPFAFLDLDAADSRKMLEEDESRARSALNHLQDTFDRVVNAHEGEPFWGGGDGAVGYFVGEGMERLALLAAIKILMLTEVQFLDNHGTTKHLKLRAGLHTGVSEWKKDPGKNISGDLSAAGHIQKHDKSAPRLTASAEFVAGLPPELRELLSPAGKSEGKEVFTWHGFQPIESGVKAPGVKSPTPAEQLRLQPWRAQKMDYTRRQDEVVGKDRDMLALPILLSNCSTTTPVGIAAIRMSGKMRYVGKVQGAAEVTIPKQALRSGLVVHPAYGSLVLPRALDPALTLHLHAHFLIDEAVWTTPGKGDPAGCHTFEATFEVDDIAGVTHTFTVVFDDAERQ